MPLRITLRRRRLKELRSSAFSLCTPFFAIDVHRAEPIERVQDSPLVGRFSGTTPRLRPQYPCRRLFHPRIRASELHLRIAIAEQRRLAIPVERLLLVLRNTAALLVHRRQLKDRVAISRLGRAAEPDRRLRRILVDAEPLLVDDSRVALRLLIPAFASRACTKVTRGRDQFLSLYALRQWAWTVSAPSVSAPEREPPRDAGGDLCGVHRRRPC